MAAPVIPTAFSDRVNDLIQINNVFGLAAALAGINSRHWMTPSTGKTPYDIQDPRAYMVAYDRFDLNKAYRDAVAQGAAPGGPRVGDMAVMKAAADYVATLERAAHAAGASRIRATAWAAARRTGHGDNYGSVFAAVRDNLNDILSEAHSISNSPDISDATNCCVTVGNCCININNT